MAFHFPLMPRIFMAVRREQRYPISEILAQTPQIPSGCQWGIFLRNHDELTLEMVTDDERDYMYSEYAKDPKMKANIGIRRRLAPLLDNDRNQLELFTALLLSLPGSPVLYYGDEIGMGDNIWLGDRDSVRTPMQWTPDRNGGFSTCDHQGIYLQPNNDPIYGYQALNVEAQHRQGIAAALDPPHDRDTQAPPGLRPRRVLRAGSSNPSVLAFVREYCAAAQERRRLPDPVRQQPVQVPPAGRARPGQIQGITPVECMGGVAFPPVGDFPYLLTLPGHGFYWFQLPPVPQR